MQAAECMELLNDVELALPVDRWSAGDIDVWPIVREQLWWRYNDAHDRLRSDPARGRLMTAADRIVEESQNLAGWLSSSTADAGHTARARGRYDAIVLGDNYSRIQLEGSWYDRLCEPLIDALAEIGLTSLHLEPNHVYRRPRHDRSRLVQPHIDLMRLRARARRVPSLPPARLDGYDAFLGMLRARGLDASDLPVDFVRRQALVVRLTADWFGRLFERVRPSVGLLVEYGRTAMAFNLACREQAIPSVVIQHGQQGRLHWAFGRWTRVPTTGYPLLPSVYWGWSEDEAVVVHEWSAPVSRWHRPVVGGNPWLTLWLDDDAPVVRRHDVLIRDWLARRPGQRHVLVTLQTGMSEPQFGPMLDAVSRRPDWKWSFRLHPTMGAPEAARARALVGAVTEADVDVDTSTRLPLYALLRHADAHVTANSSTVIEATAFGVPSVATSHDALDFYPRQAATGWLVPAVTGADLVSALDDQCRRVDRLPPVALPTPEPSTILRQILDSFAG